MDNSEKAYDYDQWCEGAGISIGLFYKLKRQGRGPYMAYVGRRGKVTESPREYCQRIAREAADQKPAIADSVLTALPKSIPNS